MKSSRSSLRKASPPSKACKLPAIEPAVPPLEDPRRELFARWIAEGSNAESGFAIIFGWTNGDGITTADLLADPAIQARAAAIATSCAAYLDENFRITRATLLSWLADVVRTPIASLEPGSPLIQRREIGPGGETVVMPDKLTAIELMGRLARGAA